MAIVITDQDMKHMNAFPVKKKVEIMREIMSKSPTKEENLEGKNNYARTISKLHAGRLKLIDLQPQETAFTTVWYGENRSLLGRVKSERVAMLVWEFNGGKEITTLRIWQI